VLNQTLLIQHVPILIGLLLDGNQIIAVRVTITLWEIYFAKPLQNVETKANSYGHMNKSRLPGVDY
jgi:hypothetical protein